jgi:hypothetical protein
MKRTIPSALVSILAAAQAVAQSSPGYTDTPMLPDGKWRVHDATRPHPTVVDPGPATGPVPAPKDAIVLFDGSSLTEWRSNDSEAKWVVADGCMTVNGTGDIRTVREFGDCQLHIEWASPAKVESESQGRGNSGVFFFERYEVQILDSFENVTYADGQAGSLYGQNPPLVNACRKPGEWQTYDIVFRAPRFGPEGGLLQPARVTLFHNGVLAHLDRPMWGATAHRSLPSYKAHAQKGPIKLQDHGNPVRFRNVWIRELDLAGTPAVAPAAPIAVEAKKTMDQTIAELMAKPEVADDAITVQHVLISFQGAPRMTNVTRSKEEAKELTERVWAKALTSSDFKGLMAAYSNDTGPGEYPMTKATRAQMVKAFGDVGFRLKVGEMGVAPWDASASPFGWHIIKRVK